MKWKPYPDYKDSGIEWLGEIPAHWAMKRLKHITQCLDGKRIPLNAEQRGIMKGDYPYWGANGIVDHVNQWLFDEELVLLGEDGAPFFEPFMDVAFFVSGKIWVNNHAHVLRPLKGANPRYLTHLLNSVHYRAFIDGSTRDKLTQGAMDDIPTQFPPMDEQDAITAFLDQEIERTDTLIAKKERQIELLQEKRAALISHFVTKGIDPNAKMKDSGYPWIGKIPDQWKVKQFKRLTTRIDVGIAEAATHAYSDQGVPIIRSTNVRANRILTKDLLHIEPWFAEKNRSKYLYANDLVTVRTGAPGTTAVVPKELDGCQCFTMLISTLKPGQIPEFYSYFLNASSAKFRFAVEGWGTAQINISVPILQEQIIVEPPESEQRAIVEYIRTVGDRLDVLAEKVTASVTKLREYKAALISAAVAGKIDVREEDS